MDILKDIQDGIAQAGRNSIKGLPEPVQNFLTGDSSQARRKPKLIPEFTLFIDCNERGIHFEAPLPDSFSWAQSAEYTTPFREVINSTLDASMFGRGAQALAKAQGLQLVTQALTAKFWGGSVSQGITIPITLHARYDEIEEVQKPLMDLLSLTVPNLQGGTRGGVLRSPGPHFDLTRAWNEFTSNNPPGTQTTTVSVAGRPTAQDALSQEAIAARDAAASGMKETFGFNLSDWKKTSEQAFAKVEEVSNAVDSFMRRNTRNITSFQIGRYIRLPSVVITDVQHRHEVLPVAGSSVGTSTGNMARIEMSVTVEPYTELVLDDFRDIFLDPRLREYAESLARNSGGTKEYKTVSSRGPYWKS